MTPSSADLIESASHAGQVAGARRQALPLNVRHIWVGPRSGELPECITHATHFASYVAPPVDVEALERAVREFCERHEMACTRIHEQDGQAYFVARPEYAPRLDIIEHDEAVHGTPEELVSRLVWREFTFDEPTGLSGPLVRTHLIRTAQDEAIFVLAFHHVLADFISVRNAKHEIGRAYGRKRTATTGVARRGRQYLDHLADMQSWAATPAGAALIEARTRVRREMQQILADGGLSLTPDRPAGVTQFAIPAPLVGDLLRFSAAHGCGLPTLLLFAQACAHHALFGLSRVPIDLNQHGRHDLALFRISGFFVVRRTVFVTLDDARRLGDVLREIDDEVASLARQPAVEMLIDSRPGAELLNYVDVTSEELIAPFHRPLRASPPNFAGGEREIMTALAAPSYLGVVRQGEQISGIYASRWTDELGAASYVAHFQAFLAQAARSADQSVQAVLSSYGRGDRA